MSQDIDFLIQQVQNESNVLVKAQLLKDIQNQYNVPLNSLAKSLHLSPTYISHYLRLLKLPETIIDGYYSQSISKTHLYIISRLRNVEDMVDIYEQVLTNNLTTLQTEEMVREKLYSVNSQGERASEDIVKKITNKFSGLDKDLSTKVIQTRVKTKVILEVRGNLEKTTEILGKLASQE